ncbi:hypothetical protein B0T25DRAFT_536591 [Lasiosphaeria hispida]|uniref:Rhodopsin domain-containing protein n=1 Tax=Lasiosphaeria hispida TaxID=260671 RepID=A0AAJ0HKQ5_9PEZI|nr:hypothetical protein B0T25DRAFT_536591 [Lasiosphaeria hispida]
MADANYTNPANHPPPGTGPGPPGVPGGTDRSYSVDIIICAAVTAAISFVFVAMRFYTRLFIVRVLHWEDWLILIAQVFSTVMCGGFIHEAVLGHGSHAWVVPVENIPRMAKAAWYTILFYQLSLWCSQVSILLLYYRVWNYPWIRHAAKSLLVFVMIYKVLIILVCVTACIPLQAFWDFELQKHSYCHGKPIWWAATYLHIITDFLTYMLPMPVIFRVQFPIRQRILLFVLFAFGFFVCLISIIRLYLLKLVDDTNDFTFDNVSIAWWSCVETNGTVSVACFMTMKPLLSRWFPSIVEERPSASRVIAASNDRLPTIGSRPMRLRPADLQRSLTASLRGYEVVTNDDERAKNA